MARSSSASKASADVKSTASKTAGKAKAVKNQEVVSELVVDDSEDLSEEEVFDDEVEEIQIVKKATRGGARRGAGRPKGSGKYGEPTKAIRLPVSLLDRIVTFVERKGLIVRLYDDHLQAGFPSPADDAPYEMIDLATKLIPHPASTFFIKVTGESMRDAGIFSDDILIVDRSLEASNGDVVVAVVDGEFTVKRLFKTKRRVELRPENKRFAPIVLNDESELEIWGVVKKVIHNV